jgi:hypothetical protein
MIETQITFFYIDVSTVSLNKERIFVPTISEFFGIKVLIYWDEYNPPHFHAEYGDLKAIVSIKDAVVIKGALPAR